MKQFNGPLDLRKIGKQRWITLAEFSWPMDSDGNIVIVPKDFITDGASIPWIFWSIIGPPMGGLYDQSAVLHDYLYKYQLYTRKIADVEFLLSMQSEEVDLVRRLTMYRAVRIGAWSPWNKYKRDLPI